jgi:predicted transposase YbfD/YdcC
MIYRHEKLEVLVAYFDAIDDPRDDRGKRHRLIDIFIMCVYGLAWGHTDFVHMAQELRYHEEYFTELLGLENGVPSHDTFSAVFSLIDPAQFLECFINWISSVVNTRKGHVAIDGKAIRAACDKVHSGRVPYLVNAYMTGAALCIGQMRVDEKTNEIKGIPELLEWLDLDGSVVTMDAIGCQREITEILTGKGADFVLAVKDNQPTLHDNIETEMEWLIAEKSLKDSYRINQAQEDPHTKDMSDTVSPISEFVQMDKGHGRIERRSYYTCDTIQSIDAGLWPAVKAAGMVVRERCVIRRNSEGDSISESSTTVCATDIWSRSMDAEEFSCYARGHWGVENSLHWVLDDCFREDRCTARRGHATENLGLMRKLVFNLMKLDEDVKETSMKGKQVYYRNTPEAMERLLFEAIPHRYKAD